MPVAAIHDELDRALKGPFTLSLSVDLAVEHRFVFLSDQHKGAGDRADEFVRCKPAYNAALDHYYEAGYTLVILGDAEELWEQSFRKVEAAHADTLLKEARFSASHYYRVWGNHDDAWMDERVVRRHLRRFMPTGAVYEGIRFEVFDAGEPVGTMLCVHGHQGTIGSDKLRVVSRFVVRLYRYLQRLTGVGQTTPARDACLRGRHDREMYEWAATKQGLILVAGHTHRPVWSSRTHLQMLEDELAALEAETSLSDGPAPALFETRRSELRAEIQERAVQHPPCNDSEKAVPCYFNTGCCRYESGNITGIELAHGEIRLVRWRADDHSRQLLESVEVRSVFEELGTMGENT